MLCVENEQYFQGSDKFWMWFVVGFIEVVKHIQEIFDITEIFRGHVVLATCSVTVGVGSDGGDKTQKSVNLFVSGKDIFVNLFSSQSWVGLWLECGIG